MSNIRQGYVYGVMGPVVDVRFDDEGLPPIYHALTMPLSARTLTVEVAQHIGDRVVRCVAMASTDGLCRGTVFQELNKPFLAYGRK